MAATELHGSVAADDDIQLSTSDGLRLCGRWHAGGRPASASVVVVHGFSASQDEAGMRQLATDLAGAGYDVLTYDARGHGGSEGWCGVGSTEHIDVACAVDVAAGRALPVVLVGVSMGGVAVARYLSDDEPTETGARRRVAGGVLVSTPSRWRARLSVVSLGSALLTRTPPGRWVASRAMRVRIAPGWRVGEALESVVERIEAPLAVVHGTGDRLLAPEHGRRLHASAAGPSRLELVPGMGHGIDGPSLRATVGAVGWVLSAARSAPTTRPGR